MSDDAERSVHPLLVAAAPAVLTTYRKDGSDHVSPVWFRFFDGAFEIVIAEGDVKLRHLETEARRAIASRYLGAERGRRLAVQRRAKQDVLLRLAADEWRVWDLSAILPS